jgi:hypothetical protein
MQQTKQTTHLTETFRLLGFLLAMNVAAFLIARLYIFGFLHGWMGWSVVPGPALIAIDIILVIASIVKRKEKWRTVLAAICLFCSSMVEFIGLPFPVGLLLGLLLINGALACVNSHRSLLARIGFAMVCAYMSAVYFVDVRFWHVSAIE